MPTRNKTESGPVGHPDESPARKLWYVSDRRIRTTTAARNATQVAEWAQTGRGFDAEPDESMLFASLHTCAFHVNRPVPGKRRSGLEQARWYARWHDIREHIVKINLGLVHLTIRRFRSKALDQDDLLSEAMCSLGRAIERFNPWKGFRFSTYACNIISRALWRQGKGEHRYRNLFPVQHDSTYEKPVESDDFRKDLYLERLGRALEGNLGELTELEATVLAHRFFPEDRDRGRTFEEIGSLVRLSKERVRQIQSAALRKLRIVLQADPILL